MSPSTTEPPSAPAAGARALLGDVLVRTMKLLQSLKHHAPRAHPEIDPMAFPVLFTLSCQPLRLSELADKVYADVSTMSRQVAHLVGLGLVERLPDPEDGRAHTLSVTPAGAELLTSLRASRETWLRSLLDDWSESDLAAFTAYLERFADAVERSRSGPATAAPVEPPTAPSNQEAS